jgi:hypothetical protein
MAVRFGFFQIAVGTDNRERVYLRAMSSNRRFAVILKFIFCG